MKTCVCGKGGSGKSTVVTLLAKAAREKGLPTLVIDSDESNSGLFRILGFDSPPLPLMEMLGGKAALKDRMRNPNIFEHSHITLKDIPSEYFRRADDLVLVSIGKILQSLEGCACPMGVLNREFLKKLHLDEPWIAFVDMEAGIEHFGRGVDEGIDQVVLLVEPSFESVALAEKIRDLAAGMHKPVTAVLNKVPSEKVAAKLEEALRQRHIEPVGTIPNDPSVFEASLEGLALNGGTAAQAAQNVLESLLAKNPS